MNSSIKTKVALLLATELTDAGPLGICNELIPFAGKHILQRIIERIVESGYTTIHVFLGEYPVEIRQFLKEGERWGCQIVYHSTGVQDTLSQMLSRLKLEASGQYLLTTTSVLPATEMESFYPTATSGLAIMRSVNESDCWTGWGVFTGAWLNAQHIALSSLAAIVMSDAKLDRVLDEQTISVLTLSDLATSASALLKQELADDDGVKFGRGSQLHPSVQVIAPVYIGQYVKVAANAVIGPNVSVGDGAFIDQAAVLSDSIVMPNTYVGAQLELRDTVVRGPFLANTRLDGCIKLEDAHLLSFVAESSEARNHLQWLEKMLGCMLKALLAPLYLLLRTSPKKRSYTIPVWQSRRNRVQTLQMTVTPHQFITNSGRGELIDHFEQTFYPGLSQVLRGYLDIHGPAVRTVREIEQLPEAWRDLYMRTNCGLLQEGLLNKSAFDGDVDELAFASDCYAMHHKGMGVTCRLVGRYLWALLRECCASHRHVQQKVSETMVQ